MAWIYLILAGVGEMIGVAMMGRVQRKRDIPSLLLLFLAFGSSFLLLSLAMKSLPMGTAYAVWTGIGAAGGAVLGMVLFGESRDLRRILCIAAVLTAAIGLKLTA